MPRLPAVVTGSKSASILGDPFSRLLNVGLTRVVLDPKRVQAKSRIRGRDEAPTARRQRPAATTLKHSGPSRRRKVRFIHGEDNLGCRKGGRRRGAQMPRTYRSGGPPL